MANDLDDPLFDDVANGFMDWALRIAYQQFPYQQPMFHPVARMRPMFNRPFPRPRYQLLSDELIESLVGSNIDLFVDTAPFFMASAARNGGRFDPGWLAGPQFNPVRERVDLETLLRVFEKVWSADLRIMQRRCREGRSSDSRLRQHDFNPLIAAPFVRVTATEFLAPQSWFVATRVSPSVLYYAGYAAGIGDALATDLGKVHEDYALDQLRQLADLAEVHGELIYEPDGNRATVDAIVVAPHVVWLVEVKSTRANLAAQRNYEDYLRLLRRDVSRGFGQLAVTAELIRTGHPALAGRVPADRPIVGSVVTAEPLFQANTPPFRSHMPDPTIPTTVLSMREFEDTIAFGLNLPLDDVLRTVHEPLNGLVNPNDRLYDLQLRLGHRVQNPLLVDAWRRGAWRDVPHD